MVQRTVNASVRVDGQLLTASATYEVNTTPSGDRFPGDPGVGKLLVGNNGSTSGADMSAIEFDVMAWGSGTDKRHSCVRLYNGAPLLISSGIKSQIRTRTDEGRVVMLSFAEGGYSFSQIAAGAADDDIRNNAAFFASLSGPIMVTFIHEPDNPSKASGQNPDGYRAAFRRIVQITDTVPGARAKVCWNSGWIMEFGYRQRDYRNWHPNWSGSAWLTNGPFDAPCMDGTVWNGSWIHLDGIDLYNPQTGPPATDRNESWTQSITRGFIPERNRRNQPPLFFTLGEHGLFSDHATLDDTGNTTPEILHDMATIGVTQHGLVACAMWSNDRSEYNATNDPTGVRRQGWRDMLELPSVVTLP